MNCLKIKAHIKTFLIWGIVMPVALSGCGSAVSHHDNTADTAGRAANDTVATSDRAFIMMKEGKPFEEYFKLQQEAVRELRDGHPKSDAISILSQTGHMLMRHGDYEEALLYLQEASDSAQRRADAGHPDPSMIQMRNNVGIVYAHFGLCEEALQENSKAIELSEKLNHEYYADLWRMRGAMYNVMLPGADNKREIADSIFYCLQRGYAAIPMMPSEYQQEYKDRCNTDKAALFVENPELFPKDSIYTAIELLSGISASGRPSSRDALLGRAYVLTGDTDKGIALMENSLEEYRKQDWKESIDWTLDLLAQSYAETNRGANLAQIYPDVRSSNKDLINETKINSLIGNDFRYRLREKQQEVKGLQEKNQRYRTIVLMSSAAALIGLLIGMFFTVFYMKLRGRAREEKEKYQNDINDILMQQVVLNNKIEQLNDELDSKENAGVIENVTVQLDPTLLSGEDEVKFRKAFMMLNPQFLTNLRRDFPVLTPADELLCMLIYLKVPPVDMAAALGISRASLNSARYRIRKRLNLNKDTNLDSFLNSIA